ncbi:MAG: hypothetical protein K6G65_01435 [Lachnospiraceae bacterium]|nr:hypothetical protein [Lachnospiraceae bacterium]
MDDKDTKEECVSRLKEQLSEEALWEAVIAFQDHPFTTMKGLPFSYRLKIGKNGGYNRELIVSRRKESKTLSWSSVALAFKKAKEMQDEIITRPKQIGDIRGISYIYPMFIKWGIINAPAK